MEEEKGLGQRPHKHSEIHVQNGQMLLLTSKPLLSSPIDGADDHLWHLFQEQFASPQLEKDLLTCRKMGERLARSFAAHGVLRQPSTQQRPLKKQYLRGFKPLKPKTQKAKDLEKIAARRQLLIIKNYSRQRERNNRLPPL